MSRARREEARILVRGPNWLGDVVMSTPGLRLLRESWPRAEIVLELPEALHPLLEGSGLYDRLRIAPRRSSRGVDLLRDARALARERFELGIVIPESISSALRMRLGGVAHVVGTARDPVRRKLLHEVVSVPADWGTRRLVARERFVLHLMGAVTGRRSDDARLLLRVTEDERRRLADALASRGIDAGGLVSDPPIVLAPGAGYGESKCWPAESFAALADRLLESGRRVLLLGGPGEGERLRRVEAALRVEPAAGAFVVLDAALDLGAVKALLAQAGALVANDAGLRHVAAAFGRPGVVFFGPTAVEKTAANLAAFEALETEHGCRPCYRRRCPIDHRCLRSIGVDEAWAALARAERRALGPGSSAPSIGVRPA
ncbi:MAG TPA: glycosyltransferase family 9 protein [Myxococcota bacterium]|nr:glycosyltransferase family 9 protein [Myxococcota bacterium]